MRPAIAGDPIGTPKPEFVSAETDSKALLGHILQWLDDAKAEEVVTIDLKGKSSIGDFMVVASGRSDRHVGAIGEQIQRKLKEHGLGRARIEGLEACDWVLIDTGDVIVHVFRPEVREFYNLERMWSAERPADTQTH
ncbi:MAG: ribosome silencing factor [Hyphomicrobiaceae bacterium]